jgi:ribose 5-phosphate isomerase RpiB
MSLGDYFYLVAIIVFSWMTFLIIRGNFQRKFDEHGRRKDLIEKDGIEKKRKDI